jgi:hypothetical protein
VPSLVAGRSCAAAIAAAADCTDRTGRWDGLPADQRICDLCAAGVEDERHFLLDCSYFSDERRALYLAIDRLVNIAEQQSDMDSDVESPTEPYECASQPASARLFILTGGSEPRIVSAAVELPVLSAVLIAVAKWTEIRRAHFAMIDQLRAEAL